MSEVIINYTDGYDEGGDYSWVDPEYAFDKVNDTYAVSAGIPADRGSNKLRGTSHDNVLSAGTITKVEIGLEGYLSTPLSTTKGKPIFSGVTLGSSKTLAIGTSDDDTIAWADITNDGEAPDPWTWADIDG